MDIWLGNMRYEEQKQFFEKCYSNNRHGWGTAKISNNIQSFLLKVKKNNANNFLDVGCGEGKYTILAQNMGFNAYGIDYIQKAIEKAKSRSKGLKCNFIFDDFFEYNFKRKFDAVLDSGFLHHIKKTDWPVYTKKLLGLTKPNSYYMLSCFSEKDTTHKRAKQHLIHYDHYDYFFSRSDIGRLFSKYFRIIKINEESNPSGKCFYDCLMQKF